MFLVPFLVFFGLIFLSRYLEEKTMKTLTLEEKGKLVGMFSNQRLIQLGITIVVVAIFWLLWGAEVLPKKAVVAIYVTYAIGSLGINVYLMQKKLTVNGYSGEVINGFMTSGVIRMLAILFMLGSTILL